MARSAISNRAALTGRSLVSGRVQTRPRTPLELGAVGWWDGQQSITTRDGSNVISAVTDVTGTTGTAANSGSPLYAASSFNGLPCFDMNNVAASALVTPNVTLDSHSLFVVLQDGPALASYVLTHNNDGTTGYLFSSTGSSSSVSRSGVNSRKNVFTNWLKGGTTTKRTVGRSYGGSHATHLVYRDGVQMATTDVIVGSPSGSVTGPLYLGNYQGLDSGFRGLIASVAVFNRALNPVEFASLQAWARVAWLL